MTTQYKLLIHHHNEHQWTQSIYLLGVFIFYAIMLRYAIVCYAGMLLVSMMLTTNSCKVNIRILSYYLIIIHTCDISWKFTSIGMIRHTYYPIYIVKCEKEGLYIAASTLF